jgi:DNA/RNA-binding domain of Phe-tRNA-synthetase-like protein
MQTRFEVTDRWRERCPGAVVACMVVAGVENPERPAALEQRLDAIEQELRVRYDGLDRAALRARSPFDAYDRFYKRFGQNYHVLHQVESVALKGKPIPRRAALVEAAFAEELHSGLLTAMHDADAIGPVITADAALGDESVTLYNGSTVTLKPDDMYMRDEQGILTTVIQGPAAYGLVQPSTTCVAVCVYAPDGIGPDAVDRHLDAIAGNMRLISADAAVEVKSVITA